MPHFIRKFFILVLVFALGFTFLLCCFVHRSEAQNGNGFYQLDPGFSKPIIPTNWQPPGLVGPGLPEISYDPLNISTLLGYSYDYTPIVAPLQMLSTSSTGWTSASFMPSDLTQQYALHTTGGGWGPATWFPESGFWDTGYHEGQYYGANVEYVMSKSLKDYNSPPYSFLRSDWTLLQYSLSYSIPQEYRAASQMLTRSHWWRLIAVGIISWVPEFDLGLGLGGLGLGGLEPLTPFL